MMAPKAPAPEAAPPTMAIRENIPPIKRPINVYNAPETFANDIGLIDLITMRRNSLRWVKSV